MAMAQWLALVMLLSVAIMATAAADPSEGPKKDEHEQAKMAGFSKSNSYGNNYGNRATYVKPPQDAYYQDPTYDETSHGKYRTDGSNEYVTEGYGYPKTVPKGNYCNCGETAVDCPNVTCPETVFNCPDLKCPETVCNCPGIKCPDIKCPDIRCPDVTFGSPTFNCPTCPSSPTLKCPELTLDCPTVTCPKCPDPPPCKDCNCTCQFPDEKGDYDRRYKGGEEYDRYHKGDHKGEEYNSHHRGGDAYENEDHGRNHGKGYGSGGYDEYDGYGNDYGGLFSRFLDWDLRIEAVNDTDAASDTTYPSIPTIWRVFCPHLEGEPIGNITLTVNTDVNGTVKVKGVKATQIAEITNITWTPNPAAVGNCTKIADVLKEIKIFKPIPIAQFIARLKPTKDNDVHIASSKTGHKGGDFYGEGKEEYYGGREEGNNGEGEDYYLDATVCADIILVHGWIELTHTHSGHDFFGKLSWVLNYHVNSVSPCYDSWPIFRVNTLSLKLKKDEDYYY